ncbi:DUF4097 domain-containing protein [Portibacter marinus]|uniref:DUF4097 domain-containing protein n=1 Tax=Portibacter marinus TaxID=2898660 RepID=UPI001F2F060D|nr:DUF4097 domain-containing protein [Portibacter marinus]
MKNKYKFLGLLGLLPFFASAQLTNNGATIVIESGAKLVVEGNISNTTGTITNSGTIEVKGDFVSDGTLNSNTSTSEIVFNGSSGDQNFDSGDVTVNKVTVNKTAGKVNLTDNLGISSELALTDGLLDIGAFNLTLEDGATVNSTSGNYIKANGVGVVVKPYSSVTSYEFPIGGDQYSPITVSAPAVDADATVGVNVEELAVSENPGDVDSYLERNWTIAYNNFNNNTDLTVTGDYIDPDDIQGTEASIVGAVLDAGMEWSYGTADATNNEVTGTVNTGESNSSALLTGTNLFRRQPIKAFLAGPYNGSTMNTGLNDATTDGLIPATSPYDNSVSISGLVKGIASGSVVDWVEIEMRENADGTGSVSTYSKFLLSDGTVANLDGTTPAVFRDAPENAFVVVDHRNHLGVMTSSSFLIGSNPLDFTNPLTGTFGTDTQKNFSGTSALYPGDANNDLYVRAKQGTVGVFPNLTVVPSDRDVVLNSGLGGNVDGILQETYSLYDVNLDGYVVAKQTTVGVFPNLTVIPSERDIILNVALGGDVDGQKTEQVPEN